jgi:hypothetical protein
LNLTFAQNNGMSKLLKFLFNKVEDRINIFEGMDRPMPNFKMVATNVRIGQAPKNYVLEDGSKLKSIVEKWRFQRGGSLLRCGYDYQIVFINGDAKIPVSICFLCQSLVFNQSQVFKISKKQIMTLLEEDFTLQ